MRFLTVILLSFCCSPLFAGVSPWIDFDDRRGHIMIPVTLNGHAARALLDTGSSGNGISEQFLAEHIGNYGQGKSIILRGVYGERRVNLVNNIQVGMFGSNFRLDQLMPLGVRSVELLVGLPFFDNYIVQIDYPNKRLRLIDHKSLNLKKIANVRMKRERGTQHPLVQVNLNDEYKPWVVLDTGNSSGLLMPRKHAKRKGWLERFSSEDALGVGVNAMVSRNQRFNLPMLEIGPHVLENVIITVPAEGQKTLVGEGAAHGSRKGISKKTSKGILGYDVLRHFIVTIDFRRSLLHMELPAEESAPEVSPE